VLRIRRWRIRTQLLALVAAAMLPLGGAALFDLVSAYQEADESARERLEHLARETGDEVVEVLADAERLFARLADRPGVKVMEPARCAAVIGDVAGVHPMFLAIELRDFLVRVVRAIAELWATLHRRDRAVVPDAL